MKTQISNIFAILIILFAAAIYCGCEKPNDPPPIETEQSIVEINYSNAKLFGNFHMAVMRGNVVYAIDRLSRFVLDDKYNVLKDTILADHDLAKNWKYIDANESGTKLLLVESRYRDVSCGALYEYDTRTYSFNQIFDKSRNISSARYFPNDDSRIVYYSYGDVQYMGAGYYIYNKLSKEDSLLYPYLGTAQQSEMLNGFDIHPSGESLLIPVSNSTRYVWEAPSIGIVNIKERRLDTLNLKFDKAFARTGIWVRYNKDASRILYCCFPYGSYTETTNDGSEVGIIELATLEKTILDVNTSKEKNRESIQLAPNWVPGENAIIYGSGEVSSPEGAAGWRHLYILKEIQ